MRRAGYVLAIALLAAGCAGDTTGPREADTLAALEEMALLSYGAVQGGEPGDHLMPRLSRLPADLALTAEQAAAIRGLIASFMTATAEDRAALAAIMAEARAARQAGATPEEVRAILQSGAPIRERLQAAQRELHQAILGVLTPAQRQWLAEHMHRTPMMCGTLSDAQRAEIGALVAAYEEANAADIALVRSAHERARAAHQAGASREEIAAILAEVREAVQRLRTARAQLMQQIQAVLTPQQRAAGCFR